MNETGLVQDMIEKIGAMERRLLIIGAESMVTLAKLHDLERDLRSLADLAQGFLDGAIAAEDLA